MHRSLNGSLLPWFACFALLAGCDGAIGAPKQTANDDRTGGRDGGGNQSVDGSVVSDGDGALTGDGGAIPDPDSGVPSTGPDVDRTDPHFMDLTLKPAELDGACTDHLFDQYALLDTRVAPLGKLVVFLPGYTNKPSDWHDHGRALASYGFHVLMPAYNNYWSGCSGAACDGKTRWKALTGENVSSAIDTSRADSAEGRVITMIKHLVAADPGGDWGYYLNGDDTLRYEEMIIAGISHGAASAALYAQQRPFWRAVMHSGGWKTWGGWLDGAPATPAANQYGFAHTADDAEGHIGAWNGFGVPGDPMNVDNATPPYGNTNKLTTSADSSYPHGSTCAHNSFSPKSGGAWVYAPAWRYMYGVAEL